MTKLLSSCSFRRKKKESYTLENESDRSFCQGVETEIMFNYSCEEDAPQSKGQEGSQQSKP